ncbi:preprotein translocase subunit YajC [Microbacterium sp. NC79]|uniref:preprotein translocase subunit YajC n=1 Tax=Microbacterium sp. NC79 TaxID=2851009 RepID=UPI001C2BF893|nr:preprotein translocase subunit YajC [Microbacterium sp. NC79]MBV0894952.1 preprotein translocase subunit YajC [Microbacterium sp. NC79]
MSDPSSIILLVLAGALLVFMMFNSRKRMKKMKEEQEAKQSQTVPGAEVLLQSGIFGTIVSYDPENLDAPAEVEIAPGVVIKAHSQAILRVIEPVEQESFDAPAIESINDEATIESTEETRRRLENNG